MKTACLAIPPVDDLYPWKAARAGLEKLGLHVVMGGDAILEADLLVTWSPWNGSRRQALQFNYARANKPVIVMENGWLSPIRSVPYFQVAFDGWNGTGRFPAGGSGRWSSWGLAEYPWTDRKDGVILVCGQRGHPSDDRTAPPDWHESLKVEGRVLRRPRDCLTPFVQHLAVAQECHVWSSNIASHAVRAGIPVIQYGPNLMVSAMASQPGAPHYRGDRTKEFQRLAWAQWNADELAAGIPFARLLEAA